MCVYIYIYTLRSYERFPTRGKEDNRDKDDEDEEKEDKHENEHVHESGRDIKLPFGHGAPVQRCCPGRCGPTFRTHRLIIL